MREDQHKLASSYNSLIQYPNDNMNSQWNQFLNSRGAVMADSLVTHFGNPASELQASAQGDIMADLSHLGLLQVGGDDAVAFLQGQLTNDVKLLDGTNSQYAGYCTAKGRLLAIFLAFAHHDHFHLQLNGALKEQVAKRLKMYVLRSKVNIADVSDDIIRIGIAGANTPDLLQQLFGNIPQQSHQLVNLETANIIRLPGVTPRFEILASPEHAPAIWRELQQHCMAVGTACWNWLEIQAGIPDITPSTQEAFVPQMVNLDALGGISFKKGCYTGQEIVARTHYLGKVKRHTYLAHIATDQTPQPGDTLLGSETNDPAGQVVRAAAAPQGGFVVLAELRSECIAAGTIHWPAREGAPLSILELPYPVA
jgi:folate-binding protein YgfZ